MGATNPWSDELDFVDDIVEPKTFDEEYIKLQRMKLANDLYVHPGDAIPSTESKMVDDTLPAGSILESHLLDLNHELKTLCRLGMYLAVIGTMACLSTWVRRGKATSVSSNRGKTI